MMKLKSLLIVVLILVSCASNTKNATTTQVADNAILVNGKPYTIKGVCYHPVPKGSNKRDFANLETDLALMKEAGMNTIRIYEPIDDVEMLDKISAAGFKIIMGFGYNQNGFFDMLSGSYIDYVKKYKSHDAILMWELGNEYNYHPEWFEGDIKNWYKALNSATKMIHKIDNTHPVSTAHGELPDDLALSSNPDIDVWGMNVYRWDNPKDIFMKWKTISNKPMYLSEAGGDSYMTIAKQGYKRGVNERAQADANKKILDIVFDNTDTCSGITLFSFTDGWWKAGDNNRQSPGGMAPNSSGVPYDGTPNEEYWGIVDIDRKKKLTFKVVKEKYTNVPN